jgi:hypothetical protein
MAKSKKRRLTQSVKRRAFKKRQIFEQNIVRRTIEALSGGRSSPYYKQTVINVRPPSDSADAVTKAFADRSRPFTIKNVGAVDLEIEAPVGTIRQFDSVTLVFDGNEWLAI